MNKPKVSIIVPVYNVEKYLDRCMDSLLGQTLKDIEIILVDDGSPDNCPQMCDEYARKDGRIKVVHKQNAGLGYARNSGLEIAAGEYVAFVDSDDYVDAIAYETMYDEAIRTDADYVCCGYKRIKDGRSVWEYNGETSNKSDLFRGEECLDFLKGMVGKDCKNPRFSHFDFAVWHGIYKRDLIRNNDVSFCSERDLISEDIVFHLDLVSCCKVIRTIPNSFYNYCLNEGTLTTKYKAGRFEAVVKLYDYICEYIRKSNNEYLRENVQARLDYFLYDKVNSTIAYEAKFNNECPTKTIKNICTDRKVLDLLERLSTDSLDTKKKVICCLMKLKWYFIIYLIFKNR